MGLELSALNCNGGRENCAFLPSFRSQGVSVYNDENALFWKDSPVLYQLGGSFFCFPNYGPALDGEGIEENCCGYSASSYWMVEKYGTDSPSGGIWVLASLKNRQKRYVIKRLDMLLPGQNVRYTAVSVTNNGEDPLVGNATWSNNYGAPFLETGCQLNSCAKTWMTQPDGNESPYVRHSFAAGVQFEDLSHVPLGGGKTANYVEVPAPNGYSDFISGRVPRDAPLGWSSVINPRQQMIAFSFFPGPSVLEEGDMPVNFINYRFAYGGLNMTPHALYDGGTCFDYSLGSGAGTNMLYLGLGMAKEKGTLMGVDTTVTIMPKQTKTMYYAMAFQPYENPRMGMNYYTLERTDGGLTLRRTKSWLFIPCEPEFTSIRNLKDSLSAERNAQETAE